jgi:hypothetical protein
MGMLRPPDLLPLVRSIASFSDDLLSVRYGYQGKWKVLACSSSAYRVDRQADFIDRVHVLSSNYVICMRSEILSEFIMQH